MSTIKGVFFFIATAILVTIYIIYISIRRLFGATVMDAVKVRQKLGKRITQLNGIQVETKGQGGMAPCLYISNHRTYLDPVMQCPDAAFIPVVMNEVASWPVIGYGVKASGVVYVKRENKSSREATKIAMAKAFDEGRPIIVYPEGGTNDQPTTKLFREGAFRIAAQKNIPIIPIAVDYQDTSFYWTDKMSFVAHVMHSFGGKMRAKVSFGEPLRGTDSKALLEQTQSWIDGELLRMRAEWNAELEGLASLK